MQVGTTLSSSRASFGVQTIPRWLGGNRLVLAGIALTLIGAAFAWQWSWLVAIGVAPLLISAAPCVAMCALGLCMHRRGGGTGSSAPKGASQNSPPQSEI